MESKDELKEIDTKNGTSYYFDNVIGVVDIDFIERKIIWKMPKIFWFITFHTKFLWEQNRYVFG